MGRCTCVPSNFWLGVQKPPSAPQLQRLCMKNRVTRRSSRNPLWKGWTEHSCSDKLLVPKIEINEIQEWRFWLHYDCQIGTFWPSKSMTYHLFAEKLIIEFNQRKQDRVTVKLLKGVRNVCNWKNVGCYVPTNFCLGTLWETEPGHSCIDKKLFHNRNKRDDESDVIFLYYYAQSRPRFDHANQWRIICSQRNQ